MTVTIAVLAGDVATAQTLENLSLARSYGAGVHAFFTGDFQRSYEDLSAAIEAGSEDPRTRYFRGLAALRLGRLDEAEADFTEGADLEARAIGGWPVSRSLERVQGHDRLQLERHRVRARVAALQRDREAERERYLGAAAAQPQVLRGRMPSGRPGSAVDRGNLFADQPDEAATPPASPAAPDPGRLPPPAPADAVPDEAAAGSSSPEADQLNADMELPPADTAAPPSEAPVETDPASDAGSPPDADEPAEGEPPMAAEPEKPAASVDPAPEVPAEAPLDGGESPATDDSASPVADDAAAPVAGDQ